MRLHFTLSANTTPVEFNYQHRLTGTFHKWLGANDLHDRISLYSLSWLDGGKITARGFDFPNGARWFVSFHEDEHHEKLVNGALRQPELFCGLRVLQIRRQSAPDFGEKYRFKVASPVFVKGKPTEDDKPPHHYLWHEPQSDEFLTKTLVRKMTEAKFSDEHKSVKVGFDREFQAAKTKLANIKGTQIKASICPVVIEGTPEAVRFAWNVGVGNGTGSGFGSLH